MRSAQNAIPIGFVASALFLAAGSARAIGEPTTRASGRENAPDDSSTKRELADRAAALQRAVLQDRRDDALRMEAAMALRLAVASGAMSPFDVLLPGVLEDLYNAPDAFDPRATLSDEAFEARMERIRASNPHPWAGDIAFGEDFEYAGYTPHVSLSSLSDLRTLAGQTAPNGNVWKTSSTRVWNGLVDNATAQTAVNMPGGVVGSGYNGAPGGPDPSGVQGVFLASPRGSVYPLTTAAYDSSFQWIARLNHQFYLPTPEEPTVTIIDMYLDSLETLTWYRPSNPLVVTNIFMGGIDFYSFQPFTNEDNIINRPLVLGVKPGANDEGVYLVAQHEVKTREWFQFAMRQGIDSFSIWMRDSETLGANPSGLPYDTPGYDGEIFASGWVQLYPGFDDNLGTPAIEGLGLARDEFNQPADAHIDTGGNSAAFPFYANGVSEFAVVGGFDPPTILAPTYTPKDFYYDNYSVIGRPWEWATVNPAPQLPFIDDMELRNPGPLAYNNGWFDAYGFGGVSESFNHTPGIGSDGDTATQVAFIQNLYSHGQEAEVCSYVFHYEDRIAARAAIGADLSFSVWLRVTDTNTSHALELLSNPDQGVRDLCSVLYLGQRDAFGYADNRLAVRVPNPDFDDDAPMADPFADAEVWDGAMNRATYPAPLVIAATNAPAVVPVDTWFQIEMRIDLDPGDTLGDLTVYLDGQELAIDSAFFSGLGASVPSAENIAPTLIDEMVMRSGYEIYGPGTRLWFDDMQLDGVLPDYATNANVGAAPFTDQPAFTVPYVDDFESWDPTVPIHRQGATPWLRFDGIDNYPGAAVMRALQEAWPVGGLVEHYVVEDVLSGSATLPASIVPGQVIAVPINYPAEKGDTSPPSAGRTNENTQVFWNDGAGITGSFMWSRGGFRGPWDGVTPLAGEFVHLLTSTWSSSLSKTRVEDIDASHPGHGQALVFEREGFTESYLPPATPRPGESIRLSFDLFIDAPTGTPTSTTRWRLTDREFGSQVFTDVIFGGPDVYTDTVDNGTLMPPPDGSEDDFSSTFEGDRTHLFVRRTSPESSAGVYYDTGFVVPVNMWLRASFTLERDVSWTLSIADDAGVELYAESGDKAYSGFMSAQINSFELDVDGPSATQGFRDLNPIVFESAGPDAPPEGGPAPISPGVYERPASYFYFQIQSIDPVLTPDVNQLPLVREVDALTGAVLGTRPLEPWDVVAFYNDTGAGTGSLTGTPLATSHPQNDAWRFTADDGATIVGGGTWRALGVPSNYSAYDDIPSGGIVNNTPPYGNLPYEPLLLGSIVELPAYPPAVPAQRVLIDNLEHGRVGCLMDIVNDGDVNGADLAALLATWGGDADDYDFNDDNVINGEDLAALLSNWGACEGNS